MKSSTSIVSLSWIKDYLSLIVLIPALLGGFWQIIELAAIGIPYIRFFSVSQMVPDGLLILFLLGTILLFFNAITFNHSISDNENNATQSADEQTDIPESRNRSSQSYLISLILELIIALAIFYIAIFPIIKSIYSENKVSLLQIILFLATFIIIGQLISIAIKDFLNLTKLKINRQNILIEIITGIGKLLCGALAIGLTIYIFQIFHNSFLLPDNFKNLNELEYTLKTKNNKLKSLTLIYFNDKYLFLKVEDSLNKTQTQVIKFEDMLEEEPNK